MFNSTFFRLPFHSQSSSLSDKVNLLDNLTFLQLFKSIFFLPLYILLVDVFYFLRLLFRSSVLPEPIIFLYSPSPPSEQQLIHFVSGTPCIYIAHIPVCFSVRDFLKPIKVYMLVSNHICIHKFLLLKPSLSQSYFNYFFRLLSNFSHVKYIKKFSLTSLKRFLFYFSKAFFFPHASFSRFYRLLNLFNVYKVIYSSEGEFYEEYGFTQCLSKSRNFILDLYFPSPFFHCAFLGNGPFSWLRLYYEQVTFFKPSIYIPTNYDSDTLSSLLKDKFPFCNSSYIALPFRSSPVKCFSNLASPRALLLLPEASLLEVFNLVRKSVEFLAQIQSSHITLLLKLHPSSNFSEYFPDVVIIDDFVDLHAYNILGICHSGSTAPLLFLQNKVMFLSFLASNSIRRDCFTSGLYCKPPLSFNLFCEFENAKALF